MRIGKLAQETGISAQAVRFYERAGLLRDPGRTQSGYRVYGPEDLKRVRFIRRAKALGFTLAEIEEMLRMHDAGQAPCSKVIAFATRHLHEVESELGRLQRFRRQLAQALRRWKRAKTERVAGTAICDLIERTFEDNEPIHARRDAVTSHGGKGGGR